MQQQNYDFSRTNLTSQELSVAINYTGIRVWMCSDNKNIILKQNSAGAHPFLQALLCELSE